MSRDLGGAVEENSIGGSVKVLTNERVDKRMVD